MKQRLLLPAAVASLALVVAMPALAEPDRTTSLSASALKFEWEGGPGNAAGSPIPPAAAQVSACDEGPDHDCDYTLVKVEVEGTLAVTLTPNEPQTDVDLYLYRSDASGKVGAELGSSAQILDAPEEFSVGVKPGYYLIEGSFYQSLQGTFAGAATLKPKPDAVPDPGAGATPTPGSGGSGGSGPGSGNPGGPAPTTAPVPGQPAPGTGSDNPPSAAFGKVAKKAKKGKLKAFKGTASDDKGVAKVEFGLLQIKGKKCKQINAKGKFKAVKKCAQPTAFLAAKGTTAWTIKLKKGLPKGKYVAFVRAVDTSGKVQAGFAAAAKRKITVK